MRIGYFQFDKTNPYQLKFYDAVSKAGGEVVALPRKTLFPLRAIGDVDILHLDWLHPFYASRRGRIVSLAKTESALHHLKRLKKNGRPKLVHTVHNLVSHDSYLGSKQERRIMQRFLSLIDSFAVFCTPVFERLCAEFDIRVDQRCYVVPHGHFIDSYQPAESQQQSRTSLGLPGDVPIVLFFGLLRENKGILDLLEVFPRVHQQSGAVLVVAGYGAPPNVDQALQQPHEFLRVFPGRVDETQVSTFFSAADVVALPFRSILNSSSAILAASMGKFSVMPEIPSVYANLDPAAILTYTTGDQSALRQSLLTAVAMPRAELCKLGDQARRFASSNLCWSRTGQLAMQMYRATLEA